MFDVLLIALYKENNADFHPMFRRGALSGVLEVAFTAKTHGFITDEEYAKVAITFNVIMKEVPEG